MSGSARQVNRGAVPIGPHFGEEINRLVDDMDAALVGTILLSVPGFRIGTSNAAQVEFDELIFQISGMRYRIAAGEVAFTETTHDIADPDADPQEAVYLLSVTHGSTAPTITKGTTAAAGAGAAPATPAGHLAIGSVRIQHDGSAVFTATTDLLSAAHITDTYTDVTPYGSTTAGATAGKINP